MSLRQELEKLIEGRDIIDADEVREILTRNPGPVVKPYRCETCERTNPNWRLCLHPACPDGR